MCVTHQACQYTHLARKSMQNTGRNQGETDIHCSFYAELLENKALAFRLSHIQLMISGLPLIWYGQNKRKSACAFHLVESTAILGFHKPIH